MGEFNIPSLDNDVVFCSDLETPIKSPSSLDRAKIHMARERCRMMYRQRKDKNLLPICTHCLSPLDVWTKECNKCY